MKSNMRVHSHDSIILVPCGSSLSTASKGPKCIAVNQVRAVFPSDMPKTQPLALLPFYFNTSNSLEKVNAIA